MALALIVCGGCDLFDEIEKESSIEDETGNACKDYCTIWVNAVDDCLWNNWGCNLEVEHVEHFVEECDEDCITALGELDMDTRWEALDCLWCIVEQFGDNYDPTCDEWEETYAEGACDTVCMQFEDSVYEFDWYYEIYDNLDEYCIWL
jgi:hypothetical protein